MTEIDGKANAMEKGKVNLALVIDDEDEITKAKQEQLAIKKNYDEQESTVVIFEDLPEEESLLPWNSWISAVSEPIKEFAKENAAFIRIVFNVLLAILYNVFFIAAIVYHHTHSEEPIKYDSGLGLLVILTIVVYSYMFYAYVIRKSWNWFFGSTKLGAKIVDKIVAPSVETWNSITEKKFTAPVFYLVVVALFFTFVAIDSRGDPKKLQSAFGILVFIVIGTVCSKNPQRIKWRTIFWGLALQFTFGLLILRWPVGRRAFSILGDQVQAFLAYTNAGSEFVYGSLVSAKPFNLYAVNDTGSVAFTVMNQINESRAFNTVFAFDVLSVIFFFSFVVSMLFHVGAMQWVIGKIGWGLQITMKTTPCESLSAAANIFVGQTEAPLLIKPFLPNMTPSEIHAVMTGGFATIAGGVLAAYISFDIPADHLLTASVMSAPAALACGKLFMPETKKCRTTASDIANIKSNHVNILDAASQGAITGVFIVANIIGSLIAVLAFVAFINGILDFTGNLFGFDGLDLGLILGYLFYPFAWLMGVDSQDLQAVARLLGVKSVVNEFVAYSELRTIRDSISERSATIATYALCGFSNPASIGIQIAGFSTLIPERAADISQVALRAYVAGSMACFLTACVAGTLIA